MNADTKRSMLINRIHNLTNDLKSGLITWKQFDDSMEAEINSKITFKDDNDNTISYNRGGKLNDKKRTTKGSI